MVVKGLFTAVLAVAGAVQAAPTAEVEVDAAPARLVPRTVFRDDFTGFNTNDWQCQYTCPVIEGERARFRLQSGVDANNYGSWSKARYKGSRFTSGRFTTRFSLTERPTDHPVWWGVALWDNGPAAEMKEFNEINFGYTSDQSFSDSELRFESAKRGNADFFRIDTGASLYDGQWHEATLEYDSEHVSLIFDGKLMATFTDKQYIPTDEMDFILGPRLVRSPGLATGFTESVDWVEIEY